jgi:Fe-S oxidoreductase
VRRQEIVVDGRTAMNEQKTPRELFSPGSGALSLQQALQTISTKCINCDICQKECPFLQEHGKPKEIADRYDPKSKSHQGIAFQCSLCQLCTALCPFDVNPSDMFLEMRRDAVQTGNGDLPKHRTILAYEKRGTSKRYSYYALPKGCHTVFFPGCALPGTRPERTWALFEHIRQTVPNLGIVLDCCTNPSHDLGRDQYFTAMFGEMRDYLTHHGIRKVLVACPSCYKIFNQYGGKLAVQTIYEFLAQDGLPTNKRNKATVTVHDPCAVRYESSVHSAVRELCRRQGLTIEEMPHRKDTTLCCGEGGFASLVVPDCTKKWAAMREGEINGKRIITYCAGCGDFMNGAAAISHVLDLVFDPEATMAGNVKVSKAPFTYVNRIYLKKKFKRAVNAEVTRERNL